MKFIIKGCRVPVSSDEVLEYIAGEHPEGTYVPQVEFAEGVIKEAKEFYERTWGQKFSDEVVQKIKSIERTVNRIRDKFDHEYRVMQFAHELENVYRDGGVKSLADYVESKVTISSGGVITTGEAREFALKFDSTLKSPKLKIKNMLKRIIRR